MVVKRMAKILIVGGGGIGSFLCGELNRLILNEQIKLDDEITIADFDNVEMKNISYQNFEVEDIGKNKAEVLSKRYNFNCLNKKIDKKDLEGFDFIISSVDNAKTRKFIFEFCFKNDIYFIDLRAEGRTIAIFTKTKDADKKELIRSLGKNKENTSCQLKYELEKGIIQQGNFIVSSIASQLILNKLREEENLKEYRYRF